VGNKQHGSFAWLGSGGRACDDGGGNVIGAGLELCQSTTL
jgi:hypothetical protein